MKKYMLNTDTRTLHIVGCCYYSNGCANPQYFETVQEAYEYGKQGVRMCEKCGKKNEKVIKENVK